VPLTLRGRAALATYTDTLRALVVGGGGVGRGRRGAGWLWQRRPNRRWRAGWVPDQRQAGRHRGGAGCGGSWPYPNGTVTNTREVPGATISSASVATLTQAWAFKLTGQTSVGVSGTGGSLAANPIVQNGVVYLQDLHSNVYALALATGKLIWECRIDETIKSGPGPSGVAVAKGMVFGQTPTSAFALNAPTGRKVWTNSHLLSAGQGTFGIQPEVADGRVYLASQVGSGPGGGVLLALNAATGRLVWQVNTVVGPDPGVRTLGAGRRRRMGDAAGQR
jgi:outer membrane protein assembly factor BamB